MESMILFLVFIDKSGRKQRLLKKDASVLSVC